MRTGPALVLCCACRGFAEGDAPSERGVAPGTAAAEAAPRAATSLFVPRVHSAIQIDGELHEREWLGAARTGSFRDAAGQEVRPYSDARFLWDEGALYLALYAADDTIDAKVTAHDGPVWIDDAFLMRFASADTDQAAFAVDVSAAGIVADSRLGGRTPDTAWESGIKVAVDRDGTLNDPSDDDEEWVVEARLPWAALGFQPAAQKSLRIGIVRCDTPKKAKRRCGSWGTPDLKTLTAELVLAP